MVWLNTITQNKLPFLPRWYEDTVLQSDLYCTAQNTQIRGQFQQWAVKHGNYELIKETQQAQKRLWTTYL